MRFNIMELTPYQRWQQRTDNGHKLSGGWVHRSIIPPREAQYEVRGHSRFCYLTWAYGMWWHQSVGDDADGMSGTWHHQKGIYDWRGPDCNACHINFGHVVQQAADMGNEEAKVEIAKACRAWDVRVKAMRKSGV